VLLLAMQVVRGNVFLIWYSFLRYVFSCVPHPQVYVPLNSIGDYYKRMQQATIDMENMFDILEEQPDIVDAPDAKALQIFGGKIEFRSVDFSYTPDRPILRDLSWCIEPGKTLALVGQSGSGKSTILRLLLRF